MKKRRKAEGPTESDVEKQKQAPGTQGRDWNRRKGPNSALGGSAICCLDAAADERGLQATGE